MVEGGFFRKKYVDWSRDFSKNESIKSTKGGASHWNHFNALKS